MVPDLEAVVQLGRYDRHRQLVALALDHSLLLPAGAITWWANASPPGYDAFARRLEFYVNDIGIVFFFALAMKEIVATLSASRGEGL
jgi:hypothetical protein